MNELEARIAALPDAEVLEALTILAGETLGIATEEDILRDLAGPLSLPPSGLRKGLEDATPAQVAAAARLALLLHTRVAPDAVADAVAETGQKASLVDIVMVGVLVLGALHALSTGGHRTVIDKSVTEIDVAGRTTFTTTHEEVNFSLGEYLGSFAKALLKAGRPDATD